MKKYLIAITILMVSASLSFMGCGSSSSGGGSTTTTALKGLASCAAVTTEAVVCGTVYAADGTTPVSGATITQVTASSSENALKGLYYGDEDEYGYLKLTANDDACQTDTSGAFACAGLSSSGSTNFQVTQSGVGTMTFTSTVTVGETTSVDAADTTMSTTETTVKWLVVPGSWDGVQLLLSQMKGCTLTGDESDPASLTASDECTTANLVVVPSTDVETTFASVDNLTTYNSIFINCGTDVSDYATVLQEYVGQGGNLYFSDLADTGLTTTFPNNVTFGSGATSTGTVAAASVDYSALETYITEATGSATMEVIFDLGGWTDISSVESNVTTYVSGDTSALGGAASAPITVGWKEGDGGCVFYTSYHIEGASTGSAQELALKYLILNIATVCE